MTPTRPQPRYEDLELRVEREYERLSGMKLPPRRPVEPEPVRRPGCSVLGYIALLLVVVLWRRRG